MKTIATLFIFSFMTLLSTAQQNTPASTLVNDHWDFINVNNMLLWAGNNGQLAYDRAKAGPGLEWPAGSGKHLMFFSGILFAGRINDIVRAGGVTAASGLQAGHIQPDGQASDPADPMHRIYRARRFNADWWNKQDDATKTRILGDLVEWPVQLGAPWIDANGNGIYDPDPAAWEQGGFTDMPRIPGEEALCFISNDLDSSRSLNLFGSNPVGMEIRTMIWASPGHSVLQDVVFREYTFVYKGSDDLTDAYFGIFDNPEVGDAYDDHCGIDTSLALVYGWNGHQVDHVYGAAPAVGSVWLQTPVTPAPGRSARFGLGLREGYRNLALSGFSFYISASSVYRDPVMKDPAGATQMFNNLRGRLWNDNEYIDPLTGLAAPFPLTGDPLLQRGWIDGIVHAPGNRRFVSGAGPFTFQPGDTQKIVLAHIAAGAGNSLLSVRELRNQTRRLHDIYRNTELGATAPEFSSSISFPAAAACEIIVHGGPFAPGTSSVAAVLRDTDGAELTRVQLHDDGRNGDIAAGDGIFGGTITVMEARSAGGDLFVLTEGIEGKLEWFVESEIPLGGEARVHLLEVASDDRNFDGVANPGENLRLRFRMENNTPFDLGRWHLFVHGPDSLLTHWTVLRHEENIASGGYYQPEYDPFDKNSYLSIRISEYSEDGAIIHIPLTLLVDDYMLWSDTLTIEVRDYVTEPTHGLLAHVEGYAKGSLGYSIVDAAALTMYDYRVSVEGDDFSYKTLHVENVSLGTTLYRDLELPERWVTDSPVIDGWKLNMGTAFDKPVYTTRGDLLPAFMNRVRGRFSEPSRSWFTTDDDGSQLLTMGIESWRSKLTAYDHMPVRLVFDRLNGQKAMLYIRAGQPNYGYGGYFDIPVRAYDISDTSNPRQIMLGFVEQAGAPTNDSVWMPSTRLEDREMLFIYADDYTEQPDPKFMGSATNDSQDLNFLYVLFALRDEAWPMFEDGDSYTISIDLPISNRDVYILSRPRMLDIRSEDTRPSAMTLHPNYPNPFGAGSASGSSMTSIRFDLPDEGFARIIVHDVLGRQLRTLFEQTARSGTHTVRFDGAGLPSGTYIISLEADGARTSRTMLLLQ
jgi:hypothetical protein